MKVINKLFNRNYQTLQTYTAGIVLTGPEVKSIRLGHIKLDNAYVKIVNGVPLLINAEINTYQYAREKADLRRTRTLLLTKKEILKLQTKLSAGKNLTIVPLACYNNKKFIKLEIALAKGKKNWEVKRIEKERDEKRRIEKEIKEYRL